MKKIALYIAACLLLTGCQTDLDIPFPEHTPLLTLNTYLVEGEPFFLSVSRSYGATENVQSINDTTILVKDAEVSVWKDGQKLMDLVYQTEGIELFLVEEPDTSYFFPLVFDLNVYRSSDSTMLPEVGEEYEFRASHPTYGNASATVVAVPRVEVLDAELIPDSITTTDFDGYQDRWTALNITLRDPGQLRNGYLIAARLDAVFDFYDFDGTDLVLLRDTGEVYSPVYTEIIQDGDGVFYGEISPIMDMDFDGQTTTLTVWVRLPNCCGYPSDFQDFGEVETLGVDLQVYLLDEDLAVFKEKHDLQRFSRTEGIVSAILPREPVSVVSNVEGGYGIVGSYSVTELYKAFD